jgi:hypothetical protein
MTSAEVRVKRVRQVTGFCLRRTCEWLEGAGTGVICCTAILSAGDRFTQPCNWVENLHLFAFKSACQSVAYIG